MKRPSLNLLFTLLGAAAALTYCYQLGFILFYLSTVINQNSRFDYVLMGLVSCVGLLFWWLPNRLRPYLLGVAVALVFADPNPSWNYQFWWRLFSSPLLHLFMVFFIPGFLITQRNRLTSLLTSSYIAWFPILFWLAWLLRLHFDAEFDLVSTLMTAGSDWKQAASWVNQYPNSGGFMASLSSFYCLCFFFFGILTFDNLRKDKAERLRAGLSLMLAVLLSCSLAITLYLIHKNMMFTVGQFYRLWGFRSGPGQIAFKAALLFFLLLALNHLAPFSPKWKKALFIITASLLVVVVTLTLSRAAMVGLSGALLALLAVGRSRSTVRIASSAVVIVILTLTALTVSHKTNYFSRYYRHMTPQQEKNYDPKYSRPTLYKWAYETIKKNPLIGIGYDWQREYTGMENYDLVTLSKLSTLRSDFFDLAVRYGILGLLAFLIFIGALATHFWTHRQTGGIFGIAAITTFIGTSCFQSVLMDPNVASLFYFVLGSLFSLSDTGSEIPRQCGEIAEE